MDILFKTKKLQKEFSSHKRLVRNRGDRQAKLIELRVTQMMASSTLADLSTLPQVRCHELTGDRKGTLSLDLNHPYRIIIKPANIPVPRKEEGGLDWNGITSVRILGIEDTHG